MSNLEELISILCCPETKESLIPAEEELIEKINLAIAREQVRQRNGETVREEIDAGLIRADGKYLYPVRREIPIMLVDESIDLETVK
ncbi:MAG: Trm112 family protein [Fidelibacterota bacterium]